MNPKISILMPVYNGEKFLREAIESVLNQSCTNFELILVNDGSSDGTGDIINEFLDSRIVVLTHNNNMGLVYSLNEGIDKCRGEFIARMDADDISEKSRLLTQLEYLENHKTVGVCGTWAKSISIDGSYVGSMVPPSKLLAKYNYWKPGVVIHPTIMVRTNLLKKFHYSDKYNRAEDYDLWLRMGIDEVVISNIPSYLYRYRINPTGISNSNRGEQEESSFRAFIDNFPSIRLNLEEYKSLTCLNFSLNFLERFNLLNKLMSQISYPAWFAFIDNLYYLLRKIFHAK